AEASATNVYWSPFSGLSLRFKCFCFLPMNAQSSSISIRPTRSPTHRAVVKLGAAAPNPEAKAHDRIAVNASQPLGCPDGHSLGQAGDHLDLLIAGEDVHGSTASDNLLPDTIS